MSKATEHNTVTYIIEGLDCANCAAKIERKIQAMPQIDEATLTFATKQLKVTSTQSDSSMLKNELESVCLSVEDGVSLEEKSASVPSRKISDGFWVQNKGDLLPIIIGAVLFTAGMIMEHVLALPTIVLFIIFAVGYLILGGQVLLASAKNISKGQIFDENFLMSIATIAAFCIGDFAEGMGVMLFYRIGELFEHIAVERSRTQIMDAVDMRPETVNLVCTHDHEEMMTTVTATAVADMIIITTITMQHVLPASTTNTVISTNTTMTTVTVAAGMTMTTSMNTITTTAMTVTAVADTTMIITTTSMSTKVVNISMCIPSENAKVGDILPGTPGRQDPSRRYRR